MSDPARFSGLARREFIKALREMVDVAAAERLRDAVETVARRIGRHPELGRRQPALADLRYRFWSIPGFPYLLVYRSDTAPPSIIRFIHTARDLPALLAQMGDTPPD